MHEPSDPSKDNQRRWFRRRTAPSPITAPEGRDAAVFTDSRVEIEIDEETGAPTLRIVSGARSTP